VNLALGAEDRLGPLRQEKDFANFQLRRRVMVQHLQKVVWPMHDLREVIFLDDVPFPLGIATNITDARFKEDVQAQEGRNMPASCQSRPPQRKCRRVTLISSAPDSRLKNSAANVCGPRVTWEVSVARSLIGSRKIVG
jgi:hypothetical protein